MKYAKMSSDHPFYLFLNSCRGYECTSKNGGLSEFIENVTVSASCKTRADLVGNARKAIKSD